MTLHLLFHGTMSQMAFGNDVCTALEAVPLFSGEMGALNGTALCTCSTIGNTLISARCDGPAALNHIPALRLSGRAEFDPCARVPTLEVYTRQPGADEWDSVGSVAYGTVVNREFPIDPPEVLTDAIAQQGVDPVVWNSFNLYLRIKL